MFCTTLVFIFSFVLDVWKSISLATGEYSFQGSFVLSFTDVHDYETNLTKYKKWLQNNITILISWFDLSIKLPMAYNHKRQGWSMQSWFIITIEWIKKNISTILIYQIVI